MDKKKIKIYEILIKGFKLTKETLTIYNFTNEDIEELLKENIIKEINENEYELADVNNLYKYGVYLKLNKQENKADSCFRQCYKLEPTNRKVCLELLLFELKRNNYIAAKNMFSILEQIEPEIYKEDNNLYLYLLSIILYNNQEYKEERNKLTEKDIIIPDTKEYEYKSIHNKIRQTILNQKYPYAITLINDLKRLNIAYNVEIEIIKELTIKAINLNNNFKSKIRTSAINKKYKRILELLEAKSKNQTLGNMEINILLVTKSILEIINTNKIPPIFINKTIYLYEAINNNNFKLAKQLNIAFLEKTNQNKEEDILNILLNDIIYLIEEIEKQNKEKVGKTNITIKNNSLSPDEELAYYIKEDNLPFKETIKKLGILPEQATIIKLIYARDYFYEGNYEEGNKIIKEVEKTPITSNKIIELLNEIKTILSKEQVPSKTKNKELL